MESDDLLIKRRFKTCVPSFSIRKVKKVKIPCWRIRIIQCLQVGSLPENYHIRWLNDVRILESKVKVKLMKVIRKTWKTSWVSDPVENPGKKKRSKLLMQWKFQSVIWPGEIQLSLFDSVRLFYFKPLCFRYDLLDFFAQKLSPGQFFMWSF